MSCFRTYTEDEVDLCISSDLSLNLSLLVQLRYMVGSLDGRDEFDWRIGAHALPRFANSQFERLRAVAGTTLCAGGTGVISYCIGHPRPNADLHFRLTSSLRLIPASEAATEHFERARANSERNVNGNGTGNGHADSASPAASEPQLVQLLS